MKTLKHIPAGRLLLLAILLPLSSLFAQSGQLILRVFEDASDAALEGATVRIESLDLTRATDGSGRVVFRDLPTGSYEVGVRYRGLPDAEAVVELVDGETVALPIRMGAEEEVFELTDFSVRETITSNDIAQQIKRNSLNVKDVIASDTMGQMPDRSVADAVRRLPGLSVERGSGQPQNEYVTIRGMYSDFNSVSIDGMPITISNADGASRSVPLNVISSSVADTIEVTKAVTPDMDGDAIGGAINIRTKNAFDYGGRHATAELAMGHNTLVDDFSGDFVLGDFFPQFDFTFSDFLNEDRTIGYSISGNFSENNYLVSEVTAGGYLTDAGLYYPGSIRLQEIFEDVERMGVTTGIEWRPDEFTTFGAKYSFSRTDTKFERQRLSFFNDFLLTPGADDGENYLDYVFEGFADKSVAYFEDIQDVHVLTLSADKELNDWTLSGDFGVNYSVYEEDPNESFRGTLTQFSIVDDFEYVRGGDPYTPGIISPTFDFEDIDNYDALLNADQITFEITDAEYSFAADAARDLTLNGQVYNVKFGGKVRLRNREFDVDRRSFGFADIFGNPDIPGLAADYAVKNRVDGAYDGGFYLDPQDFLEFVNELEDNAVINQDIEDAAREALATYEADENVYATFAQASTQFGKLSVLGGVRLEFTDVDFKGSQVDVFNLTIDPLKAGNDYLDVLPGIHFRYDATEDLIVRASVNKTLARPSYRQLNPSIQLDPGQSLLGGDLIETGNIDLDPTESWNLDLGVDYYYSEAGYVSAGIFAKYMENNIYERTRFEGTDEIVDFQNADSAEVHGFEFLIDQGFSFLPAAWSDFGASFNLTLVDSEVDTGLNGRGDDTPLFGQVETAVNASLYYRGPKLRARLSYNWTDDFLLVGGIDADDPKLDEYADAYGTLDFTLGYFVTDNIEVFFEAENLTDEANRGYYGDEDRLSFNSYKGTTYFIGANWTL